MGKKGSKQNKQSKHSLTFTMLKSHRDIAKMVYGLKKDKSSDHVKKMAKFLKFKWELEKHFFIEEKIVMTSYKPHDNEAMNMVSKLIEDHNNILNEIIKIETKLKIDKPIDMAEFGILQEKLFSHKNFEDSILYPKMDEELDDEKIKLIIGRINEQN